MVTIVSFIIVLSILVLAHELGHYAVGRWAGAKIEEFAIGFPPRLWSIRRGGTDYSINSIPLGGYCRFLGEDGPDVPGGLMTLPRLKRAAILVAGVTMNMILAVAIFAVIFATGYPSQTQIDGVKVRTVVAGAPADVAGLKPGDIIIKVNDQPAKEIADFSAAVRTQLGQAVTLVVNRAGGEQATVSVIPRSEPPAGEGPLGIAIEQNSIIETKAYGLGESLWLGVKQTWRVTELTISVPMMIVRGLIPAELARPVGPIGIARIVGDAAESIPSTGFWYILQLMAFLSVNLAIVNILPLPGLDGGRLVFVFVEWLRGGKRLNPQREGMIHFAGLMLLVGLIVVITFFDIVSPAPVGGMVP
jgi:regulator of sigma E protease